MSDELYIWISRWREFQHYRPQRDRGPAWIKDYTRQLDDDRYLNLTDRQRALLSDLRRIFAVTLLRVPHDTRAITRHRHSQTFRSDLEALNHAGFIEVVSREVLEQRLEELYRSSRPEAETEVEKETEAVQNSTGFNIPDLLKPVSEGRSPNGTANAAIATLVNHLTDADRNTGRTLQKLRLPDHAYLEAGTALERAKLIEHIRSDSGYVVTWLRDWKQRTAS
jgi:hypothetical protein